MENYTINPPFEVVSFDELASINRVTAEEFIKTLNQLIPNIDQSTKTT